jgi:hypothetical protein
MASKFKSSFLKPDATGGFAATQIQKDDFAATQIQADDAEDEWQSTRLQSDASQGVVAKLFKSGDGRGAKVHVTGSDVGIEVRKLDGTFSTYRWHNIQWDMPLAGGPGFIQLERDKSIEISDHVAFKQIVRHDKGGGGQSRTWLVVGLASILTAALLAFVWLRFS